MKTDPRLAIERVMLTEAAEIAAAREKCLILHGTTDIDAAGDEVEICVRTLIGRRLGHMGHGHIVDSDWNVSPQLDVIIADSSVAPAIFRSENGTEYFPYESVYAFGEIKATYRKAKTPIDHFVKICQEVQRLKRDDVPANYIRTHSSGFYVGKELMSSDRKGRQNNLFTFMVFAGAGDFQPGDVTAVYSDTPVGHLPNAVCLLDRGLVVYVQLDGFSKPDGKYRDISLLSQPSRPTIESDRYFAWTLYSNGVNDSRALSWGVLYGMLTQHLLSNTVKPESPIRYLQRLATTPVFQFLSEPDLREKR